MCFGVFQTENKVPFDQSVSQSNERLALSGLRPGNAQAAPAKKAKSVTSKSAAPAKKTAPAKAKTGASSNGGAARHKTSTSSSGGPARHSKKGSSKPDETRTASTGPTRRGRGGPKPEKRLSYGPTRRGRGRTHKATDLAPSPARMHERFFDKDLGIKDRKKPKKTSKKSKGPEMGVVKRRMTEADKKNKRRKLRIDPSKMQNRFFRK